MCPSDFQIPGEAADPAAAVSMLLGLTQSSALADPRQRASARLAHVH